MISIVIPISRKHYLDRLFANLDALKCKDTNLLTYVDGDYDLFSKARNFTVASKFNEKLCVYRNKGIASDSNYKRRRLRISDIHNEIRGLISDTEYVFLIEDDTLVPADALERMLKWHEENENVGIVSGIQVGRWGFKMLGAWEANSKENPTHIWSAPMDEGIKPVHATGMYCCLAKSEDYLAHEFKPYQNFLGPDFDWGMAMMQKGKQNYVDYDIPCVHMTKKGDIGVDNVEQVEFRLLYNEMKLRRKE